MKKMLNIVVISLMLFLLSSCGFETGSNEAIIEDIDVDTGTVSVSFNGEDFLWQDKTGSLTYGDCSVEYKYRDNEYPHKYILTSVSQEDRQKHYEGDVRNVDFDTNIHGDQEVGTVVTADDFYAYVTRWGVDYGESVPVELLDSDDNPVDGIKLTEGNKYYYINLRWEDYSGYTSVKTAVVYKRGSISFMRCENWPNTYYINNYYCGADKVTQVFSNGDFVVENSVYCINDTGHKVHEGSGVYTKFRTIGTKWMTTVLGTEKEYGVVEIIEFID